MSGAFRDGATLDGGATLTTDVCVIGSGAGGAVVASALAGAHDVLVLEEGGHHTRSEFKMREDQAYPMLYQEGGRRATKDLSISLLQGRAVGGTTVVNWTTCFRTPGKVLEHWRRAHDIELDEATLRPHFEAVEARLNIQKIDLAEANRNNRILWDGCQALGLQVETLHRNVKQCMKSGFCGMGCPIDAKQSMLVTYLPDAVARGATVWSRCRVDRLEIAGGLVERAHCTILGPDGYSALGPQINVRAKRFILSAGAIGTPAILLRSGLLGEWVGRRTFLHPAVGVLSRFREPVEAYFGAPQSVASHALADRGNRVGLFLEAAPIHPMFAATAFPGFGEAHRQLMADLPHYSGHGAIAIDGFHDSEPGGRVTLRPSGAPQLDYVIPERVWEGLREGVRALVRINLAAGAERVLTGHDPPIAFTREADLARLDAARFEVAQPGAFSFHIMGGAKMGNRAATSVVRAEDLRHHQIGNLHVVDGSVLPTSLGVNPQETIYALAHLVGERLRAAWA
jgi:choline dehydrogenase-like flavoprotein